MKFYFDAVCVSVKSQESKGKVYHSINLDQDGDIITLACSPEVFNQVKKYQSYRFTGIYTKGEFDGRVFTRMTVSGVEPLKG